MFCSLSLYRPHSLTLTLHPCLQAVHHYAGLDPVLLLLYPWGSFWIPFVGNSQICFQVRFTQASIPVLLCLLNISSWFLDHPLLSVCSSALSSQLFLTSWTKHPCSDLLWRLNIWLIPLIWFPVSGVQKVLSMVACSTDCMQSSVVVCMFQERGPQLSQIL